MLSIHHGGVLVGGCVGTPPSPPPTLRCLTSDAIKLVRACRPGSLETVQQETFVHVFEQYLQHLRCGPRLGPATPLVALLRLACPVHIPTDHPVRRAARCLFRETDLSKVNLLRESYAVSRLSRKISRLGELERAPSGGVSQGGGHSRSTSAETANALAASATTASTSMIAGEGQEGQARRQSYVACTTMQSRCFFGWLLIGAALLAWPCPHLECRTSRPLHHPYQFACFNLVGCCVAATRAWRSNGLHKQPGRRWSEAAASRQRRPLRPVQSLRPLRDRKSVV